MREKHDASGKSSVYYHVNARYEIIQAETIKISLIARSELHAMYQDKNYLIIQLEVIYYHKNLILDENDRFKKSYNLLSNS